MSVIYIIDSNCIMDLTQRWFRARVFGSLHRLIDQLAAEGRLLSSREVYEELRVNDDEDEAFAWCRRHKSIFLDVDEELQGILLSLLTRHRKIVDPKNPQRNMADPWLIAMAVQHRGAVLTHEKKTGSGAKVIKIPDVCEREGVMCLRLIDMMEREGWSI